MRNEHSTSNVRGSWTVNKPEYVLVKIAFFEKAGGLLEIRR
jgi:hypothetical protein